MALGILVIINMILLVLAITFQILLYKNNPNNNIIIINMLFGLLLSYLAFTALPTNFTIQRTLTIVMGIVAILAVVVNFKKEKSTLLIKLMLSVSIGVNLILLLL